MGLISNLLKLRNTKNKADYQASDSYGTEITRCLIEIKLTKKEFEILMMEYYMGHTSYKSLLNPVFAGNPKKILMVIEKAKEKALDACNIDFTFIRFFSAEKKFIDIPFSEFSQKKDMRFNIRNMKLWHRENIKRIIVINPKITQLNIDNNI